MRNIPQPFRLCVLGEWFPGKTSRPPTSIAGLDPDEPALSFDKAIHPPNTSERCEAFLSCWQAMSYRADGD
jgi:hypothetical protein